MREAGSEVESYYSSSCQAYMDYKTESSCRVKLDFAWQEQSSSKISSPAMLSEPRSPTCRANSSSSYAENLPLSLPFLRRLPLGGGQSACLCAHSLAARFRLWIFQNFEIGARATPGNFKRIGWRFPRCKFYGGFHSILRRLHLHPILFILVLQLSLVAWMLSGAIFFFL